MPAIIKIGLENNPRGRSQAWALDYPGWFAYGKDGSEALQNVPVAVLAYREGEQWSPLRKPLFLL